MQWNNLPFWAKALIIAIVGGVIVFLGYKFAPANIAERRQDIAKLDEEILNLESEVRTAEAAAAKRKEVEAEIARLDGELQALRSMLPERRETGALLKFVRDTAERMSLDLQLFNPEPEVQQEFVTVVPVRIRVTGGYHALGEFFEALGGHIRIIFVDDVNIQPAPRADNTTIDATFTATTYIYNYSEPAGLDGPAQEAGA